jgi:hypothetical protein
MYLKVILFILVFTILGIVLTLTMDYWGPRLGKLYRRTRYSLDHAGRSFARVMRELGQGRTRPY